VVVASLNADVVVVAVVAVVVTKAVYSTGISTATSVRKTTRRDKNVDTIKQINV